MSLEAATAKTALTPSAIEYVNYGCNPVRGGCQHGCLYCYMPGILRIKRSDWCRPPKIMSNFLQLLGDELPTLSRHDMVMLSTSSDPFQPGAEELSCEVVKLFIEHGINFRVLSKNERILDLLTIVEGYDRCKIGMSITTANDDIRREWEPHASSVLARIHAIETFHRWKIPTWVSLEPMLPRSDPVSIIGLLLPFVDEWIIGRLNNTKGAPSDAWCIAQINRILAITRAKQLNNVYLKKELQQLLNTAPSKGLDAFLSSS